MQSLYSSLVISSIWWCLISITITTDVAEQQTWLLNAKPDAEELVTKQHDGKGKNHKSVTM